MSAVMKLARSSSCPSVITTAMMKVTNVKPMKTCGNCGGFGHNRRTCGVPEHYAAICHPTLPPSPAHKTTQKQCSSCGLLGHNRRTCVLQEKVDKTHRRCGRCGAFGHNRRTCPVNTMVCVDPPTLSTPELRAATSLASLLD